MHLFIKDLSKTFLDSKPPLRVLRDINLEVREKEFIAIFGPNGCGKTTIFNIVAGFETPTHGTVIFDKGKKTNSQLKFGFVFQDYRNSILPWRTIQKNVELGLELQGLERKKRKKIAQQYLKKIGLSGFEDKYPYQVSGGMAQLVALARALAYQSDLLLLDEPFSSLDYKAYLNILEELQNLWLKERKTTILITHNLDEAIFLADRLIILSPRPATVIENVRVRFSRPRKRTLLLDPRFLRTRNYLLKKFQRGIK